MYMYSTVPRKSFVAGVFEPRRHYGKPSLRCELDFHNDPPTVATVALLPPYPYTISSHSIRASPCTRTRTRKVVSARGVVTKGTKIDDSSRVLMEKGIFGTFDATGGRASLHAISLAVVRLVPA